MHPFREHISSFISLSPSDWGAIEARLKVEEVGENAWWLEEGKICRKLGWLESGLLRYVEMVDGEEKTKFFTTSGQLFTSSISFADQTPAAESIQVIRPARIHVLSFDQVQEIYQLVPTWALYIRRVLLSVTRDTDQLLSESKTLSAEERYRRLLQEEPELVRDVSIKHLASYLGIAPESLSRIRRRLRD